MKPKLLSSCRGSVIEVLLVLLLIFVAVSLMIRPWHSGDYVRDIRQRAQLASMSAALELHANEFDGYPPSDANDPSGVPYCGTLRLAEAVMGQDLLGVHSDSAFRADGLDATGRLDLYPDVESLSRAERGVRLKARKGPYLRLENANATRLVDIYGKGHTGLFDENLFVSVIHI